MASLCVQESLTEVISNTESTSYRTVQVTSSYRCFTSVLEDEDTDDKPMLNDDPSHSTGLDLVREGVIGRLAPFSSPFGTRPIVYADWTASGRGHKAVEDFLNVEVLPLYGNTHTTTSITGNQSTCFRHEARQAVAEAVNAKVTGRAAQDVVLFTGSGCTAAIDKLVRILGLHLPAPGAMGQIMDESARPVVFVGPMEHHSNLLPWRESAALVIQIQLGPNGTLDLDHLEEELINHRAAPFKIGSFSAASNVSGLVEEVDLVTRMLHHYDALACWDYASAAPYIHIDMNPLGSENMTETRFKGSACKDAVFFSPHKFVGGIGAPGVLVVKKRLLENKVPSAPGGGTVFYVTTNSHRYLSNREEREEGGTPDIIGTCRCALAFKLKRWSGPSVMDCHRRNMKKAFDAFSQCPNLVILANGAECLNPEKRLPTYSFMIRWSAPEDNKGRWLHYNFIGALLNDLFGVQCRGGCQCAGPYGQQLLNIDRESSTRLERCLMEENTELMRPGFSRLSLPYTLNDIEVDYVIQTVLFVAEHGWKFLPQYRFNHKTGECKHVSRATKFPNRKWLGKFSLSDPAYGATATDTESNNQFSKLSNAELEARLADILREAHALAAIAGEKQGGRVNQSQDQDMMLEGSSMAELRWFVYPSEASDVLIKHGCGAKMPTNMLDAYGVLQPQSIGLNNPDSANRLPAVYEVTDEAPVTAGGKKIKYPYRSAHSDLMEPPIWAQPKVVRKMLPSKDIKGAFPEDEVEIPSPSLPSRAPAKPEKYIFPVSLPSSPDIKFHGVLLPAKVENDGDVKAVVEQVEQAEALLMESEKNAEIKKTPAKLPVPPKKMMRAIGQAIRDWKMISDGDRLVVGLSGGKDSLSLLCALVDLQRRAPVKFTLSAVTIDPMTPSFDPSPLKEYLKRFGITYHYLSNPIIDRAAGGQLQGDSLCAFCSRMKRGMLYGCCRDNGYNKLVLGQHLDDLAESFIMSSLHNGQIRTMKANYKIEAGDVSVIRPLVYVREFQTKEFAKQAGLPIINENCPACFEEPKERHRVKKMLAREESLAPEIFPNLKTALLPLMAEGVYPYMELLRAQVTLNETVNTKHRPPSSRRTAETQDKEHEQKVVSDVSSQHQSTSKDSVKWSNDCLSVVPDSWLEEELQRRRNGSLHIVDKGGSIGGSGGEVQLCGTGKCEMFD